MGNPFVIGEDGTRAEVIRKYKEWILNQLALQADMMKELKGKDLICYCSPKECHGDVILSIANEF